jgi:hypothetical protein
MDAIDKRQTPEEALEAAMKLLETVLKDQARQALEALKDASEPVARQGADILGQMLALGTKLAKGEIDAASAELGIDNYLAGLELLIHAEANLAKVEAMKRGLEILRTVKSVLVSVVKVALNYYVPGAGVWVDALGLPALLDEVIPSNLS